MALERLGLGFAAAAIVVAIGSSTAAGTAPVVADPNNTTALAYGPGVKGDVSIGTPDVHNRGARRVRLTSVRLVWDTSQGRTRGGLLGGLLQPTRRYGNIGDSGIWPPDDLIPRRHQHRIPGAHLPAGGDGQVIVGVRAPGRGTSHLTGVVLRYRSAAHRYRLVLPLNYWFCYRQTDEQCHAQAVASPPPTGS